MYIVRIILLIYDGKKLNLFRSFSVLGYGVGSVLGSFSDKSRFVSRVYG